MKHTVYRYFSIGAYEKEEAWLNEMAAKGMLLTDIGLCRYVFTEGMPGSYIYRIELLKELPSHAESIAYLRFLEETGIEFVGSCVRWAYFRRPASDGPFALYSDTESKIRHFKRITAIANTLSAIYAVLTMVWLWEAWKQYQTHMDWVARGFENEGYYLPWLINVCLYTLFIVVFQLVIGPIRKSLRQLKAQKKLGE